MIIHLDKDISPDDEVIFLKARKHWFGLFVICSLAILALLGAMGLFIWLTQSGDTPVLDQGQSGLVWLLSLVAFVLVVCILAVISWLYRSSLLSVTNEEVHQVIQGGLFHRRHSRLGLANVEDVTFVRKGIFATILNFGELNIETAGEQANFKFSYCPKPNVCAKAVMDARDRYFEEQGQQSDQRQTLTR